MFLYLCVCVVYAWKSGQNRQFSRGRGGKFEHSPLRSKMILVKITIIFIILIAAPAARAVPRAAINFKENDQVITSSGPVIEMETTYVRMGEAFYTVRCPLQDNIELKKQYRNRVNLSEIEAYKKKIINKTVIEWKKDGKVFHRENGNPLLDLALLSSSDEDAPSKYSIHMVKVGESDTGRYCCEMKYPTFSETRFFELPKNISFYLYVVPTDPDEKPTISHPPPENLFQIKGTTAIFPCRSNPTLSTKTTYWFKSCNGSNETCIQDFLDAYNKTKDGVFYHSMANYFIESAKDQEEFRIANVSDDDVGYYGCLVSNVKGIDIRLSRLRLFESPNHPSLDDKPRLPVETSTSMLLPTIFGDPSYNIHKMHGPQTNSTLDNHIGHSETKVESSKQASHDTETLNQLFRLIIFCTVLILIVVLGSQCFLKYFNRCKTNLNKKNFSNLVAAMPCTPSLGGKCKDTDNLRQHLPPNECTDVYNISKTSTDYITGHLREDNGQIMTQSVSSKVFVENSSISSNTNSDESFSWGKTLSSHGDISRAFYQHFSNSTSTTVPMYDHPPPTCTMTQFCGNMVQNACVINPIYGFIRPVSDTNSWVFPRRNLERLNKIGEGQFGEVWRYAAMQKDGTNSIVAVKRLKERAGLGARERLELLNEMEIMKLVNNHPNVIKLLNYCIGDDEPILLIMEFADNGKLQTYLRNCRSIRREPPYPYMMPRREDCYTPTTTTSKELIKFSYHIAKGMEYVSSQGIIHRDLASRNILVSKEKICKVADFGFARKISDDCAYERTTTNPVPVKWMAPEALCENKFTTKSDVYSFGVLMWEIATLGATPYESLSSKEVYDTVKAGGTLTRPSHCKNEFYDVMASCWLQDPTKRPNFRELAYRLEQLLLSENDYIELDQYPEHAYYNIEPEPELELELEPKLSLM